MTVPIKIHLVSFDCHTQVVPRGLVTSDWVAMAPLDMGEDLRYFLLDSGMLFVMISSIFKMLTWCADNLD